MKLKDFHMHPNLMNIPERADDFAQRAIEFGLQGICFTDHMPLSFSKQADRIPHGSVSRYCEAVRAVADKYKDKISIKCGIEMDYHPDYLGELEQVLCEGTFDYIIGSSHLQMEGYGICLPETTADEYADKSLRNILMSVKSGYFDTVAHIDMYRWIFANTNRFPLKDADYHWEKHKELLMEIFEEIKRRDMFLEVNTHFWASTGRVENIYPAAELMQLAKVYDLKYQFGSDAHKAEHVGFGMDEIMTDVNYVHCWKR